MLMSPSTVPPPPSAAQGLIRLGRYLGTDTVDGKRYVQAGLTSLRTMLTDTYLGVAPDHQGLLLHSVYHQPNGCDHIPEGQKVPCGEACMWETTTFVNWHSTSIA